MELYDASDLVIGRIQYEGYGFTNKYIFKKVVLGSKNLYKSISQGAIYIIHPELVSFIDILEIEKFSSVFPDVKVVSRDEARELEAILNEHTRVMALSVS